MAQVQVWIYDLSGGMAKVFSRMLLDKQASSRCEIGLILMACCSSTTSVKFDEVPAPDADLQVDGVWHTSVVLRGREYYFGHGINVAVPGTTPCGSPVETLDLG